MRAKREIAQQQLVSKSERLGRIINYMAKFRSQRQVQISVLDALVAFAEGTFLQNQAGPQPAPPNELDQYIPQLVTAFRNTFEMYTNDRWITWRLYRVMAMISIVGTCSPPKNRVCNLVA